MKFHVILEDGTKFENLDENFAEAIFELKGKEYILTLHEKDAD